MVWRNLMPSLSATISASFIMSVASCRVSGNWQIASMVAWLRALIGLNVRLPNAFNQISDRISEITRDLKPARINASLMRLRSKRRRPESELEAIPESQLARSAQHDDTVARRELESVLMRCAESLPGAQRDLLLSRYLNDRPLRSIARELNITEGGVKARLHRARAALRTAFFAALGPEPA